MADELGVKIFTANVIYHLFDQFTKYIEDIRVEKQKAAAEEAVFPVILQIIPEYIFNKKDPIIVGVDILEGLLKLGTPISVKPKDTKEFIDLGKVISIEKEKKNQNEAKKRFSSCN